MHNRLKTLAVVILAIAGLDQLTKAMAVAWIPFTGVSLVDGWLDLILVYNTGAAFSMFAGQEWSRWLLTLMTLIALGVVLWLVKGPLGAHRGALLALGLVAGGAVGNLIDRLRLGKVTDFVDLHYLEVYHWPAFNLADAAISLGGVWLASYFLRGKV